MTNVTPTHTQSTHRGLNLRAMAVLLALLPACGPTTEEESGKPGPEERPIDEVTEPAQRPANADDFEALKAQARAALTQEFSVPADDWTQLTGEQGSTLFFQPNSFLKSDGTFATGDVDVSFIELFDKGSMLVTDMPSNGLRDNGDIALLVSGGEHFVDASQNGEALKMHGQFQLTAPAENTGGPDLDMQMFRMNDEAEAWVAEDEDADRKNFGIAGEGADTQYWTLQSQFGWTNIDRWYSDPRPKTTIHVSVPDGWDDSNATVYLSYDGEDTALARMDVYDATTGLFSEHYGLIPIGLEVHLIFVTELDGQWSYSIQSTTITDNHLTSFDTAEAFIETDMDGLVQAINALP